VRHRPFSVAVSNPLLHYLNVAMDEDGHALEHVAGLGEIRRVPRVSLGVDIFQGDLAAGLPVIRDKALGLVPREAGDHTSRALRAHCQWQRARPRSARAYGAQFRLPRSELVGMDHEGP